MAAAWELFEKYADEVTLEKIDRLEETLSVNRGDLPLDLRDDFARMDISGPEDIREAERCLARTGRKRVR